jgi:uncharacterized coiled-coil protein SlyX
MTTEELETRVRVVERDLAVQEQALETFSELLGSIDGKLDDLRISVAKRNGALDEARRHAKWQGSFWGGVVAAMVAGISAYFGA